MQERVWRDDYELVGGVMDPRMLQVGIHAARLLRDNLAQQFFPLAMRYLPNYEIVPHLSDTEDTTRFAYSYGPNHRPKTFDMEVAGFTGARLTHQKDGWKLRCAVTRYRPNVEPNKSIVRYFLDVEQDWVLQARVETRVLSSDSDEYYSTLLEDDSAETSSPTINRVAFERPLTAKDCVRLQTFLNQALHQRVKARRRPFRVLPA